MQEIRCDNWSCDTEALTLERDGQVQRLEPKQVEVLRLLVEQRPHIVTANQLLDAAWKGVVVGDNAVHRAIAQLRKAIGDNARKPNYIESIPRRGYRFIGDVSEVAPNLGRLKLRVERSDQIELAQGQDAVAGLVRAVERHIGWSSAAVVVVRSPTDQHLDYVVDLQCISHGQHIRIDWSVLLEPGGLLVQSGDHSELVADLERNGDGIFEHIATAVFAAVLRHRVSHIYTEGNPEAKSYWDRILIADRFRSMQNDNINERERLLVEAMKMQPNLPFAFAAYADLMSWKVVNGIANDARESAQVARDIARNAIEMDSEEPYTLLFCGCALSRIGDYEMGVNLSRRAVAVAPGATTRSALAIALSFAGAAEEATDLFENLLANRPAGQPFQFGRLAITLIQQGKFEEAYSYARLANSHFPNDFFPWLLTGNIAARLNDMTVAENAIAEAQRLMPDLHLEKAVQGIARTYGRNKRQRENLTGGLELLRTRLG